MNLLMVGQNKRPGSWDIRGLQVGAALGARTTSTPTDADWQWADLVVLVKHAGPRLAAEAHRAGVPIVWDALDFWPQPGVNGLPEDQALRLLRQTIKTIRPALVIGATEAMAEAAGGVYLPHHSRVGLEPAEIRPEVQTVAYEGSPLYPGSWLPRIEQACRAHGWAFVVNPPDLREADLVVALRDGPWDGWICRQWKSGVKLVNAIAAGRPIIRQPSAASAEILAPGATVETAEELEAELTRWAQRDMRALALETCCHLAGRYRLDAIAERYRGILSGVRIACLA